MTLQAVGATPSLRMSVVLPTLAEAGDLPHALPHMPLDAHEVIVIDGCSVGG
jgi:hypothetical protein